MTHREILDALGNLATDAEADAMSEILQERGISSLDDISDRDFSALIPLAIERSNDRT